MLFLFRVRSWPKRDSISFEKAMSETFFDWDFKDNQPLLSSLSVVFNLFEGINTVCFKKVLSDGKLLRSLTMHEGKF